MKLKIDRKNFIDALTIGGALSSKKNTMPILECSKIKVDSRQLVISSSDGDMYATKRVFLEECDGEKEFCVISSDLLRALRSISEDVVRLDIDEHKITIFHTYGSMKLPYESADEFPTVLTPEEERKASVNCEWLYNVISSGKNFICGEKGKSISGMYLYCKDGKCGICCADVNKMFIDCIETDCDGNEFGAVIPAAAIPYIMNTINGNDYVHVVYEGKTMTFKVPNARINCRLLDVKFPPFEKVIPQNNTNNVALDMDTFRNSVNRAKIFADARNGAMITLDITDGNMDISAKDVINAKEGSESVEVAKKGEDVSISLSGNILSLCLSNIDSAKAVIRYHDNCHGVIFEDLENKNRIILQMPII